MTSLPQDPPPHNEEAAPFWAAAADGRLVVPVCDACGHHIWYPRAWCPVCQHEAVTWTELSGRGTVYARTIIARGLGAWADAAPYVVAYVELEEGPRVLTNVVTDDPSSIEIGMPVTAVFLPVAPRDGEPRQAIVRFAPSAP